MAILSNINSSGNQQGQRLASWMRSISPRRAGILVLTLALLLTAVSYTLHSTWKYLCGAPQQELSKRSVSNGT